MLTIPFSYGNERTTARDWCGWKLVTMTMRCRMGRARIENDKSQNISFAQCLEFGVASITSLHR